MSAILVPYNSAMRLGYGFNSYTQQLCINDAVRKADKTALSDKDLVENQDPALGISQVATYTSKYVSKISDVTDSLNISGALEIKLSAINASGSAKASFIDTDKFKDSDLNFLIQVRVTNYRLVPEDVTVFAPIDGLPTSQFTEVYGDSYISGFVEGGELNGLVSIKLADRTRATDIQAGASLSGNLPGGLGEASGNADVKIDKALANAKGETTISVSWSGGGDIKGDEIQEWNVENLQKAAIAFPPKVALCPQRIYAIVTKYKSLRSWQESMTKLGSPLDYENAGVYASELLEAYIDYKNIWKQTRLDIEDLGKGDITLTKATKSDDMTKYAAELLANYKLQKDAYDAEMKRRRAGADAAANASTTTSAPPVNATGSSSSTFPGRMPQCCIPVQPNPMEPYEPTVFGLEKARQHCRNEMIKIVQEVDAIALDPTVALDSSRCWQYVHPAIFKLLLPTGTKVFVPPPKKPYNPPDDKIVTALAGKKNGLAVDAVCGGTTGNISTTSGVDAVRIRFPGDLTASARPLTLTYGGAPNFFVLNIDYEDKTTFHLLGNQRGGTTQPPINLNGLRIRKVTISSFSDDHLGKFLISGIKFHYVTRAGHERELQVPEGGDHPPGSSAVQAITAEAPSDEYSWRGFWSQEYSIRAGNYPISLGNVWGWDGPSDIITDAPA